MKNLKLISVLALGMLLMLGACKKDDPSSTTGKVELSIAALGTDGAEFCSKLEAKGWTLKSSTDKEKQYTKDSNSCTVKYDTDKKVKELYWTDKYGSFDDAKKPFADAQKVTTRKYTKKYAAYTSGFNPHWVAGNPDECLKFVNEATKKSLSPSTGVYEQSENDEGTFSVDNIISVDGNLSLRVRDER
ncbi:MAG: hypothetical protein MJ003_05405 [Paludibacteraceae bacterium]|nr:hypothetical protein [Paludibacteraceae bacterium]